MVNTQQKILIKCDYEGCTRAYTSTFNLRRHIEKVHFGIKKFKCTYCQKHLSSKQNLIDHQNVHSGARPYICDVTGCNIRFRQLSQFYLHKQMHQEADMKEKNVLIESFVNLRMLTRLIAKTDIEEECEKMASPQEEENLQLPMLAIVVKDDIIQLPGFAESFR